MGVFSFTLKGCNKVLLKMLLEKNMSWKSRKLSEIPTMSVNKRQTTSDSDIHESKCERWELTPFFIKKKI